jgi:hypothetical protein
MRSLEAVGLYLAAATDKVATQLSGGVPIFVNGVFVEGTGLR